MVDAMESAKRGARNMRVIFAIAIREIRVVLGSPMGYWLAAVFLAGAGMAFVKDLGDPFPEASLTNFFVGDIGEGLGGAIRSWHHGKIGVFSAALILIPLGPLLTMKMLAEERRLGTIELLLTAPVRDWEVVLGKYAGSVLLLLFMLCPTGYYVVLLLLFGRPDLGPVYAGYIGLVLYGMVSLSVGIFASSITSNQVVAAVVGTGIMGTLYGASLVGEVVNGGLGEFLMFLGLLGRMEDFAWGIIDSGNIVYFGSLVCLFLFLAWRTVEFGRWR